jgi:Gpi18-like mannosyltransferase
VLALILRLVAMPFAGNTGDIESFDRWTVTIAKNGLFSFYDADFHQGDWDRTYPPFSTLAFGMVALVRNRFPANFDPFMNHTLVLLFKLVPVFSELALIVVTLLWLRPDRIWHYAIPILLAISPGLIATTAWWGQYDAVYTLFLVLSLIALNRDQVIAAWLMFGVVLLFKQPAIVFVPLIAILSFRRYGLRKTIRGAAFMAILCVIAFAPFAIVDGVRQSISSYLEIGGPGPSANLTDNAFNVWHLVASIHKGAAIRFGDVGYSDTQSVVGTLTFSQVGAGLMLCFVAMLMFIVWKHAQERKEFVWGAALYLGYFLLPTQVHERYLYSAAVMILLAISQDKRVLWLALGILFTFSYNILQVILSYLQPSFNLWPDVLSMSAAVLNCLFLIMLFLFIIRQQDKQFTYSTGHQ